MYHKKKYHETKLKKYKFYSAHEITFITMRHFQHKFFTISKRVCFIYLSNSITDWWPFYVCYLDVCIFFFTEKFNYEMLMF